MIKVVLIGGGEVAWNLAQVFLEKPEIELVQVYNRSLNAISFFQNKTSITSNLNALEKNADIYIVAISDNAISEFSQKLNLDNKLVVHTSGGMDMNELNSNSRKGVFYLLQSFSKNKSVNLSKVPICIEAQNKKDLNLLRKLANSISENCYEIDSLQRKKLHVAAVFVNNFVNHMYYIGKEICDENEIPFQILEPLILETVNKLKELSPFEAQTGPARRHDSKTIATHLELLNENQQNIYTLLSNSIAKTYGEKL